MRLLDGIFLVTSACLVQAQYKPNWDSLDSRPLPAWYDEAKIGVFMHWGPYSVPGINSEWFWFEWDRDDPSNTGDQEIVEYMKNYYPPGFKYQEFGPAFRAEFFNATQWAQIVENSGAKYFVFTSKHHDGFSNWPSKHNFGWNSRDLGPKRDVVGELSAAFENVEVRFGLYHSLFEWFNPLYLQDKSVNYTTREFVKNKIQPELQHLIQTYKPQVLWSDGEWEAEDEYWGSQEFIAWLYNESPVKDTIVTNDRWGRDLLCKHGDFYTCTDRYNPGVLQKHKWENAMTIDRKSWGHRRNMNIEDILSMEELIETLAKTVSCGGNLLMNVGPNSQGTIEPIFQERLGQMGDWLKVNGEAIYGTVPWIYQNDTVNNKVWYTSKVDKDHGTIVYGILLQWPDNDSRQIEVRSPEVGSKTQISMLGGSDSVSWERSEAGQLWLYLPERARLASQWGWVIRFEGLTNAGNSIW